MRLNVSGLTGPALNLKNAVERALTRIGPLEVVSEVADLPPARANQGRQVIVRDLGPGIAFALDGAWFDKDGSAL